MVIILTEKKIKLLNLMLVKGCIDIKSQNIYSPLAFRINMTLLENQGIVTRKGTKDRKNLWCLTDKGIELAKKLKGIEI